MSSLFGSLGAASQTKPALFGTQTGTPQPSSSLFSSLNNAKPAQPSGSVFGSSLQPPPAQPASGGLFGSIAPPAGNQQQPQTKSLFGASAQPQPQQSGSLFAAKIPEGGFTLGAQGKPAGGSLFGGSTNQQHQQPVQPLGQSLGQSQQGQQPSAYFDSLLEKSRKRAHGESTLEDLPSLQLGLGDLRQRIRKLGPVNQDRPSDGRAQYLLAGSGVDLGAAVRDLTYFDTQTSRLERTQATTPANTDVEGYLASLQTQTTLSMIASGLERSAREFDAFLEDNVTMEWDAQRKRIYQHFGIKPRDGHRNVRDGPSHAASSSSEKGGFGRSGGRNNGQSSKAPRAPGTPNGSVFGRSSMQKSVIGTPGPIGTHQQTSFVDIEKKSDTISGGLGQLDDRIRREKQVKFAEKVQILNAARVGRQTYPVLHEFASVEAQTGEDFVEHVVKAYKAIIEIVGERPGNGGIKERQFMESYYEETETSQKAMEMRKRILDGSSRHLEKQFFQDLEALIAKNPREANLGGVPDVLSKVRAYVRLRASRKDLVSDDSDLQLLGDDYAWALVFYLLRCGHVNEAVQYVISNEIAFRAIDRNFVTYLSNFNQSPDRRLKRELQDRINNEYNQRVRIAPEHSIDPFRMACYNIIGRCDVIKKSFDGIITDMQDWLWLQFVLGREVNRMNEVASEVYGLKEVQTTIDSVVSKHAPGNAGFGVFFYLQILSGRFEQAIAFLYSHQYVDAVHFAIALAYYGMLRISGPAAPDGNLLAFSIRSNAQLSFARMVGYYTQDFRAGNVVAAVDYLTLICLNGDLSGEAGQQQVSQCHEALRELILESREFAQLLGDVNENGERIKGAIEERLNILGITNTKEFMRSVTLQAAAIADDNGRTTDAVLLYHLAEEYDNVVAICSRAMSEAIALPITSENILPRGTMSEAGYLPFSLHPNSQSRSALSLTACDNPIDLAIRVLQMYNTATRQFKDKVLQANWETCLILISINDARNSVANSYWTNILDIIAQLDILPIHAQGDSTRIRQCATKFSSLDQRISRLVPQLMIWSIEAAGHQKAALATAQFGANDSMRGSMLTELNNIVKDLMMYSGFLKYRLPTYVNDALARVAAE